MKSYENHYQVEDEASVRLVTYDSSIASVFEVPTTNARDMAVNYVGVLKDIFMLEYGPLNALIVLLRCEWLIQQDNQGQPTYTRDDADFLVVNSKHKLPCKSKPFIFSNQATQVIFSDDHEKPS